MRELSREQRDWGRENDCPSVKNQRFLTAPLTRGAKGACGAERAINPNFAFCILHFVRQHDKSQLDDLFLLSYHTTGEKPRDAEKIPYIFLSPLEKTQCLR